MLALQASSDCCHLCYQSVRVWQSLGAAGGRRANGPPEPCLTQDSHIHSWHSYRGDQEKHCCIENRHDDCLLFHHKHRADLERDMVLCVSSAAVFETHWYLTDHTPSFPLMVTLLLQCSTTVRTIGRLMPCAKAKENKSWHEIYSGLNAPRSIK